MTPLRILLSTVLLVSASRGLAQDITPFDPLADAREFDPGLLREWSRNSINILATYQDFKESLVWLRPKRYDSLSRTLVDKEDTWFLLLEGNILSPVLKNGSGYGRLKARTDKGDLEVDAQKSYGTVHAGYLARDWEAGVYAIADLLELRAEEENNRWHSELYPEEGGEHLIQFKAGKTIIAGYGRWGDWSVDAGTLIKYAPLTSADSAGKPIFRLRQKDDSSYTGESGSFGIFLAAGKAGYSFNTLISLEDKLETLGLGLPAFGMGGFSVTPFVRYQAYRSRIQAGAEASRRLFPIQDLHAEAAGDVHRNSSGGFEAFHHIVLGQTLTLFGLPPERLATYHRYDFRILFDADLSVSSDAIDETAWGFAGAFTLLDMGGVVSYRLGMGYNDWRYLRLFPERDAIGIDIMIRLAW
ncbi:MAG: hypothetical protein ABI036_10930 [Fibrobacteria bacterium]